ncbi:MAG: PilN domain-containing protein [Elusimicrobia bacterium]|nr:PilN domain-containing protein [Elusimicrobiota bacterium]
MIRINLFPEELWKREAQKRKQFFAALGGSLVTALLLGVSLFHWWGTKSMEKKLRLAQEELKKYENILSKVDELQAKKEALEKRMQVVEGLMQGRAMFPQFMEHLVRTLPSGIWLTALTTQSQERELRLDLSAYSLTPDDITRWIRALESSGHFSAIDLGGVTAQGASANPTLQFSLRCTYKMVAG